VPWARRELARATLNRRPHLVIRPPPRSGVVGRMVVDATCDGECVEDVRLLIDDGTTIVIDAELDNDPESLALAEQIGRPGWPRLRVPVGGRELWRFERG